MPTDAQFDLVQAVKAGETLELVEDSTNRIVKAGDKVYSFRGDTRILDSFDYRRVYVKAHVPGFTESYYPSVYGLTVRVKDDKRTSDTFHHLTE